MEWWGFSSAHGWVVLDRSIPSNRPGIKEDLLFFRCRDSTTFTETREKWNPPLYRFAPNYIRALEGSDATQATAELEVFQSLWLESQRQMQRELRESAQRAEAARIEEEKKRKAAERKAKKESVAPQPSAADAESTSPRPS